MTCIIVEDLAIAADYLAKCCEKSSKLEVKGRFLTAEEALNYLSNNQVDLIFLDVEMPGANGFQLLDQLVYKPKVILTTSKTEYAYDAFQYNVSDYLKKPFTYPRFLESLQKLNADTPGNLTTVHKDHVFIKTDSKLIRLNNQDILFIESMGDYVRFVTNDKKYITHNTIKSLEEKINKQMFLKVHRSFIVNISKIEDIRESILYIHGNEIPFSKNHKADILNRLNII